MGAAGGGGVVPPSPPLLPPPWMNIGPRLCCRVLYTKNPAKDGFTHFSRQCTPLRAFAPRALTRLSCPENVQNRLGITTFLGIKSNKPQKHLQSGHNNTNHQSEKKSKLLQTQSPPLHQASNKTKHLLSCNPDTTTVSINLKIASKSTNTGVSPHHQASKRQQHQPIPNPDTTFSSINPRTKIKTTPIHPVVRICTHKAWLLVAR